MSDHRRARPERILREFPLGNVYKGDGDVLYFGDLKVDLRNVLGNDSLTREVIFELVQEIEIYRSILKEVVREQKMPIRDNNEYHRSAVSFANKIGIHVDDFKSIMEPLIKDVFSEMFVHRPSSKAVRNEDH